MIELVIPLRETQLSAEMSVKRILPFGLRRMVGPFAFLDHLGPMQITADGRADVLPHPHIGLATVTYLFEGELQHRDSLGSLQTITPGDINWMTAGRGVVHSERFPRRPGQVPIHGLQAWVALPLELEECDPSFAHYPEKALPRFEVDGVRVHLLAGFAFGYLSPVKIGSPLFCFAAEWTGGQTLSFDPKGQEAALYLVSGQVTIANQSFTGPTMVVFTPGKEILIAAQSDALGMMLGGEPLLGARHVHWNFVSSSRERIERAKSDWIERRFPEIPGETEWMPYPLPVAPL